MSGFEWVPVRASSITQPRPILTEVQEAGYTLAAIITVGILGSAVGVLLITGLMRVTW